MNEPQSETPETDAFVELLAASEWPSELRTAVANFAGYIERQRDAALTDRARFEQGVESLKAQLDALRVENEKFTRLFIGVCDAIGYDKGERLFENAKKIVGEENDAIRAEMSRLRTAIEQIAARPCETPALDKFPYTNPCSTCIARAALKKSP